MFKRQKARPSAWFAVALGMLFLQPTILGQRPTELGLAEVERLKTLSQTAKTDPDTAKFYLDMLDRAGDAFRSGRVNLGLWRLQQFRADILGNAYRVAKKDEIKEDRAAYEREWKRVGAQLKADKKLIPASLGARQSALLKALVETSVSQIDPYYQSGRFYGLNTSFEYGLLYFGLAPAHLDFLRFSQRFPHPVTGGPMPTPRRLDAELSKLESETADAYAQPSAAQLQQQFIAVSSTLKLALDLNQENRLHGALFQYLEARRRLAYIRSLSSDPPTFDFLSAESARWKAKLDAEPFDASIAATFWEAAQATLDVAAKKTERADDLRRAAVVYADVLPAFMAHVSAGPEPPKPEREVTAQLTVRLMRWPYT